MTDIEFRLEPFIKKRFLIAFKFNTPAKPISNLTSELILLQLTGFLTLAFVLFSNIIQYSVLYNSIR